MSYDLNELKSLTAGEKLAIIDALYDSLDDSAVNSELISAEKRDEIRRREQRLEANPDVALTWEKFERRLDAM